MTISQGTAGNYVITDATAVKIRAEDGRSIRQADISAFINNLPGGRDTSCFSTEDASGQYLAGCKMWWRPSRRAAVCC